VRQTHAQRYLPTLLDLPKKHYELYWGCWRAIDMLVSEQSGTGDRKVPARLAQLAERFTRDGSIKESLQMALGR